MRYGKRLHLYKINGCRTAVINIYHFTQDDIEPSYIVLSNPLQQNSSDAFRKIEFTDQNPVSNLCARAIISFPLWWSVLLIAKHKKLTKKLYLLEVALLSCSQRGTSIAPKKNSSQYWHLFISGKPCQC